MSDDPPFLEARLERGVLVLTITRTRVEGEEIAQRLKEELLSVVADYNASSVVLDLRNTRYVSSIAFWPLLALRKQLAGEGGRLIICGLTGAVEEVFTSTKMVDVSGATNAPFEMAPDLQTAIDRLADRPPATPNA